MIIDILKERIFSGDYRPGDRLPSERELAQKIEVSRSAVREAYHALELLGIVEVRRGTEGGTFIKELTHRPFTQNISDLMRLRKISIMNMTETRLVLEKALAQLVVERITREDLIDLKALIDAACDKINRGLPAHEENVRFHVRLSEASRNPLLTMVYSSVMDLLLLMLQTLPATLEASAIVAEEHIRLLSLLESRDLEQVLAFLDRHIRGANKRILEKSGKNSFFTNFATTLREGQKPETGLHPSQKDGPGKEDKWRQLR